jgi:hypothetical protein
MDCMDREAINVKAVKTKHGGIYHTQVFLWSDKNARAMQDRILDQQRMSERRRGWRCLKIGTRRLLDLLGVVLTTAPDTSEKKQ